MLKWSIIFLIISFIAAALGFSGVAGASAGIAQFLFVLFLIVSIVLLVLGYTVFKKVT